MRLVLIHREQLQRIGADLVNELDNLVARIKASWLIEHTDEGGHGDITAESVGILPRGGDYGPQSNGIRLWSEPNETFGDTPSLAIRIDDRTGAFPDLATIKVGSLLALGDIYAVDDVRVDGTLSVDNGSVSTPSITFSSDSNSGFYGSSFGTFGIAQDGVNTISFRPPTGIFGHYFDVNEGAFGTGALAGPGIALRRNTSGNGAAGWLCLEQRDGADRFYWSDGSGLLRVGSGPPTEDNSTTPDTSGTVVGDQTSQRSAKHILAERTDTARALHTIVNTPVFDFTYRDGRYHGETFTGITTNDSPMFAKDQGRSFNEINAFGYLVNAVKEQQKQIEALRAELLEVRESRMTRAVRWMKRQWRTRT